MDNQGRMSQAEYHSALDNRDAREKALRERISELEAALSAERARVIEPLQKIIERSENGELGTSKVRDMANIAKAALRALGQQDNRGEDHG